MNLLICPFCQNTFPTVESLIKHLNLRHYSLLSTTFHCQQDKCYRNFSNIYAFSKHLKTKHAIKISSISRKSRKSEHTCAKPEQINPCHEAVKCSQPIPSSTSSTHTEEPSARGLEEFGQIVANATIAFVAKLYASDSITRALVQEMVESITEFMTCGWIDILKQQISAKSENKEADLNEMFNILSKPFSNLESEHQRFKFFENSEYLIRPKQFAVGTAPKPIINNQRTELDIINLHAQIIPVDEVLQKFLQLPHVFEKITSHIEELKESETAVHSLMQSDLWKSIERKFEDKLVLPLILYFDDFEVNNPLGSHTTVNKLGAVYYTLGCIPPEYSSMLENIFLAQLHNTIDQMPFGNKIMFAKVINEIVKLEDEGIRITVGGVEKQVYFALTLIAGDNLGLHSILGFVTGFNANYACRFCVSDKATRQSQLSQDAEKLRNPVNYAADCTEQINGIIEECVFNVARSYHAVINLYCDVMHDFYEGVCRYDIAKVLFYLVYTKKYLSLETLNDRIRFFDYGSTVDKNKPPEISQNALKKGCVICSASEMLTLVRYLGLIIGDLIPVTDEVWDFYTILREVLSIVMASSVRVEDCQLLNTLVSEHHSLYLKHFKEPLKPKHHHMVHYSYVMTNIGPLRNLSCMRFEAKHKELKNNAKVVCSRRNISYTLALKHQLKLSQRFLAAKGFEERLFWGVVDQLDLSNLDNYKNFSHLLPDKATDEYISVSWAKVNGTVYKAGHIVVVDMDDEYLRFGKIQYVLIDSKRGTYFLFKKMTTLQFSKHVHAFQVVDTNDWGFISQKSMVTYVPSTPHVMANGKYYIPSEI